MSSEVSLSNESAYKNNWGRSCCPPRRAGAKTPCPFDEVPRRVRTGEPRPGTDRARDTHRRFRSTWRGIGQRPATGDVMGTTPQAGVRH